MEVAQVEDEDLLLGRVRLPKEVHLPMVDHAVPDLVDEPVAPKVAASVEVAVVDVLVLGGRRLALLQLHYYVSQDRSDFTVFPKARPLRSCLTSSGRT